MSLSNVARLMPRRIAAQMALLVAVSLVVAHVVAFTTFYLLWRPTPAEIPFVKIAELAYTAKLLDAASSGEIRARIVEAATRSFPDLRYSAHSPPIGTDSGAEATRIARALRRAIDDRFAVSVEPPHVAVDGREKVLASVRLPDGSSVSALLPRMPDPPEPKGAALTAAIVLASTLTLLSVWAATRFAAPLTRFAEAADQFNVDGLHEQLPEQGPLEIERAARALNEMRSRIKSLVDDRTRMLAAVGHDLRTPITRLLLRVEDIVDPRLRRQCQADLRNLGGMIESALSFLREQTVRSKVVKTDISSLLQSVCDNFVDIGSNVEFAGPPHCLADCDPDQISRAITNLIENAVKFGPPAVVRLTTTPDHLVEIEIEDHGPGIPDAEKEKVFEPFYRSDSARRSDELGGFGLGLSIARAIVRAHGGSLTLADAAPSGLVARFSFPVTQLHDGSRQT
jgi:signal transduction histidine kinase